MAATYIGLVHYPIYNKHGQIVTTALTNFDLHDIARTARTYGIAKYFVIHPLEPQVKLARDVMEYWQDGYGGQHHKDRREAFRVVDLVKTIEEAVAKITSEQGCSPYVVTTDARVYPQTVSYQDMREKMHCDNRPCLLLFGTGWGIERETMARFDYILEPIYGPCDYNHLPVRSAVAIILDRLLGEAWWRKDET